VFIVGILFFLVPRADGTDIAILPANLYAEQQWTACHRECLRGLQTQPDNEAMKLLAALSARAAGMAPAYWLPNLEMLATSSNKATRALAAYHLGQNAWDIGQTEKAWNYFATAFADSPDQDIFLLSGCSLDILRTQYRELEGKYPDLQAQLDACADLWTAEIRAACGPHDKPSHHGVLSWPGRAVVSFYRTMVSPALGQRCSLQPSCSEYFRQATIQHGLLGMPIQADRFFREPSVVVEARHPVFVNGKRKFADPLSDHDYWLKKETKRPRTYYEGIRTP